MAHPIHIDPDSCGECASHRPDAAIAALAGRQHGVVARWQLEELGLSRRVVEHRVERGRLHVLHRGVYAVGHRATTREARWMAAVLTARGSTLSHRSAAALWRIWRSDWRAIEITVAGHRRGRKGVLVRRATLSADEITVHDGIPVTTPARTLLDLAAILEPHRLERAVNEAEVRRLASPTSLDALVARYPRRPGTPAIRELLEKRRIGANVTKQELEHRFLAFLDAHGIGRPRTNRRLRLHDGTWIEPDCHWPGANLIVELDGGAAHHTRHAFESDRARDRKTVASGHRVVRITWRQLHENATALAGELRALLSDRP